MRLGRGSSRRELLRRAGALAAAGALGSPRARAAVITRYPYLQHVLASRATIIWTTSEAGSGSVQFSTDEAFTAPVTVQARARRFEPAESLLERAFTQFEADLTGLASNARYYYRVFLGAERLLPDAAAADFSFRTAPVSGGFRFLAFGDSGGNTPDQYALRDVMLQEQAAAFALHTGDIAYPFGTHQTYELYYLRVYRDLMRQVPLYPAVGNHEIDIQEGAAYLSIHALPVDGVAPRDHKRYYSFDWGDAHVVSLDSNLLLDPGRGRPMLEWLNEDLARTRKLWKIVTWHHTPYDGARGEEPEARLAREFVVPILERHGVQLVLAGHSHIYGRTMPLLRGQRASGRAGEEGIVYITTGGGGGGLHEAAPAPNAAFTLSAVHFLRVEVDGVRLAIRAIGLGGRTLDTLTISPRPTLGRSTPVNAATLRQPVAPGALINIFGQHLASQSVAAPGLPLPVDLAGVKVSLDGRDLPLAFVSPERITAQLPFGALGAGSLRIGNGAAAPVEVPLSLLRVAPGIFETASGPAVASGNGALASAANPAVAGETVAVFMTGLGEVAGEIAAGAPAPVSPLVPVQARVEVEVGGKRVIPSFAGLAPGQAGVYQVNVQVPVDLATGRHTMVVLADGVWSNEIVLDVRGAG